ncbi:MAG: hypothetical protein KDD15_16910 [Lewinella sp.]|nr:hypothetical protein [Lewinella sp.]
MTAAEKRTIQDLIARGNTIVALEQLESLRDTLHQNAQSELVQLSARWYEYQRKERLNLLSESESGLILANINHDLLQFLNAVGRPPSFPSGDLAKKKRSTRNILIGISSAIALLAGLAEITGLNLLHFLGKQNDDPKELEKADQTGDTITTVFDTTTISQGPSTPPSGSEATEEKPAVQARQSSEPTSPPAVTKSATLNISATTNKGSKDLHFRNGETMRLFYRVTRPCRVRVIYKLADDRLILFYDDQQITADQVGQDIELGDGFVVAPPYGQEALYLFAQSETFPALITIESDDGYTEIRDGLPDALRKTRGFKKKTYFAETQLAITTME